MLHKLCTKLRTTTYQAYVQCLFCCFQLFNNISNETVNCNTSVTTLFAVYPPELENPKCWESTIHNSSLLLTCHVSCYDLVYNQVFGVKQKIVTISRISFHLSLSALRKAFDI